VRQQQHAFELNENRGGDQLGILGFHAKRSSPRLISCCHFCIALRIALPRTCDCAAVSSAVVAIRQPSL
jgi:hypothetical protein